MGLLYKGSWFRASVLVCGLSLASLSAWAQPLPEPPLHCDLAFRILPYQYSRHGLETEVLKEQPLVRVLSEAAVTYLGIDPLVDLSEGFEGTVVGGILSDPKSGSSLGAFYRDRELRTEREALITEMESLVADLDTYYSENEAYPEDYQKFIDEYRYYEPYLPEGVTYEYQRREKGYRLLVTIAEPSRLGELGPAPVFGSDGFAEHTVPSRPALPLNFLLGFRVADPAVARDLTTQLVGPSEGGFWVSEDDPPLVATLRGSWLVVSDRRDNLGPFLQTLNGKAPGISKSAAYRTVARNIDMDAPAMFYSDLPKIVRSLELTEDPGQLRMLELLGPTGYSFTPMPESEMRMAAFVGLRAPRGSELEALLQATGVAKPEAAMVAANIPWDVSNAVAVDYQRGKRLFDAVVALSPEAAETMEMLEDVGAGFLGLDAERGFDQLVDGWVVVSFERLDIFVNAFEGFSEDMNALPPEIPSSGTEVPEGTGGPEGDVVPVVDPDGLPPASDEPMQFRGQQPEENDPSADAVEAAERQEPTGPDQPPTLDETFDPEETTDPEGTTLTPVADHPPRLPFTVAFQISDTQAREALLEALTEQLGDSPRTSTVSGVEVHGREDGLLSYAVRDNWFYLSGGKTQRLLRNLLAAATGRKESLTSLQSWARFRTGQRGDVIMIGHQKVDAFYSLVKGFLLALGPDFRPLAYELGRLRDYHTAGFLVPDGVLVVGDVLQGDDR